MFSMNLLLYQIRKFPGPLSHPLVAWPGFFCTCLVLDSMGFVKFPLTLGRRAGVFRRNTPNKHE
jgi:hypothetical protein